VRRLLLTLAVACNGSSTPNPSPRPPISPVAEDAQIASVMPADADVSKLAPEGQYAALCAPCHGKDAKGYAADNSPSLVNPTFLESATDDFLQRSIIEGRPGTSMGAYGKARGGPLDDAAVAAIVKWLRDQGPKAKPLEAVAKGDGQAGQKVYNEYCKTCHGDSVTRGTAPHLANAAWQRMATDAFIRYGIANGRPETKMPAFGTVMTPKQIDDLVAYIRVLGGAAAQVGMLPPPTGKEPMVINPKGRDPMWKPRDNRFIGVDEVAKAMKEGKRMIIIDARPPSEWMRAHIKGAISIPYHEPARLDGVPKDVYVIAYCACPHHLSGVVVDELIKRGHKKALVLDEGVNVWHTKNYPMVVAEGVKAPALEPPGGGHDGHDHSGHGH
jgi:cytochrome c oxidase cbb3-type subunit 3/ubiquinol-cytochrome c reductase cytochrome c subunit